VAFKQASTSRIQTDNKQTKVLPKFALLLPFLTVRFVSAYTKRNTKESTMAPQESTRLLDSNDEELFQFPVVDATSEEKAWYRQKESWLLAAFSLLVVGCIAFREHDSLGGSLQSNNRATGPYHLVKAHEGESFFDGFEFYEGADSLGSAGYLTYLDENDAVREGLANVTREHLADPFDPSGPKKDQEMVYMSSQATEKGPRDSVRLEGKQRYNRGLFILDLRHLPTGCGVWPAFWMTDEDVWPDHGEIDVGLVEGSIVTRL
jgi:hypothetical protein